MSDEYLVDWYGALPRRDWLDHAACAGEDWRPFFTRHSKVYEKYCARCCVVDDCLVYALRHEMDLKNGRAGVYGGMTPTERHEFGRSLKDAGVRIGTEYRLDLRVDE